MCHHIRFETDFALPLKEGQPKHEELWAKRQIVLDPSAVMLAASAPIKVEKCGEETWMHALHLVTRTGLPVHYLSEMSDFSEVLEAVALAGSPSAVEA